MRGDSALGDLMHDFFCRNASAVKSKLLATRTNFVKNNEKEVQGMSEYMERMMAEREKKTLLENVRALMTNLKLTAEAAMTLLGISPEKQKELAPLI